MHSFLDRLRFTLVISAGILFVAAIVTSQAEARMSGGFSKQKQHRTPPSWYLGVSGSVDFVEDADVTDNSTPATSSGSLSLDQGYGISGSVGYRTRNTQTMWDNIRVEGEVGYHQSEVEGFTSTAGATTPLTDDEYTLKTVMANVFIDFDVTPSWRPYLGMGIGAGYLELENATSSITQDDTVFAYQGMAGLTYIPRDFPLIELSAGYRYIGTQDMEFTDTTTGADLDIEYGSHNLEAGARFFF